MENRQAQKSDGRATIQPDGREARRMRATGISRRIDDLGRIVIPKELRNTYHLDPGTLVEIYTHGGSILLQFELEEARPYGGLAQPLLQRALTEMSYLSEQDFALCMDVIARCKQTRLYNGPESAGG